MSDYIESLFQGVDILIDKKLETLAYDTTIICRIVDNTDCKNGKYRVSDGSVTYFAYSENTDYKLGQSVRVSIPNNDFSQKKFILGKYGDEENSVPITYVSSIDNVINISGNLASSLAAVGTSEAKTFGIAINGYDQKKIIWNRSFLNNELESLQTAGLYNTLILKADFKTLLSKYQIIKGTYGLRVDLLIRPTPASEIRLRKTVELTNHDMFGDPYNFIINSTQSKTFSMSTVEGVIEGIELSLFQNDDFVDAKLGTIDNKIEELKEVSHIFVTNIEVALGAALNSIPDNSVQLYSLSPMTYKYDGFDADSNQKKIGIMWFNKDENGNYIGFSDGYYDPEYDELTYQALVQQDERLTAQKGKEGIPEDKMGLTLAADLDQMDQTSKKIAELFKQNLFTALYNYFDELKGAYSATSDCPLDAWLGSTGVASQTETIITNTVNPIKNYYLNILAEIKANGKSTTIDLSKMETDYQFSKIANGFHNLKASIDGLLTTLIEAHDEDIYKGVVDVHTIRVNRILNQIDLMIKNLPSFNYTELLDQLEIVDLKAYFSNGCNKIYMEEDLSCYEKRYCIYWYKYQKGAPATTDFMPNDWVKLDSLPENINLEKNIGIPNANTNFPMNEKLCQAGEELIVEMMPNDSKEQKYVAIIFYNHEMFKSNELIFTNADDVPDVSQADKIDGLSIEHIKDSFNSYQIYSESYHIYDGSDEFKERQIRCHFNGLKLNEDDVLPNASIYWYIPKETSMITYDEQFLKTNGFIIDNDLTSPQAKEGHICFYKQIKFDKGKELEIRYQEKGIDTRDFWYKVKSYYESSYPHNYILCKIIPNGSVDCYETKIYFTFGIKGTSGTKYTLAIANKTSQSALINTGTGENKLELDISLRDVNNEQIDISFANADSSATGLLKSSWIFEKKNLESDPSLALQGINNTMTIQGSGCGIFKVQLKNFNIGDNRKVTLEQIHSVPWGKGNYYLSGPTSIIYNSLGTLDKGSVFDIPYRLFNVSDNSEIQGLTWTVKCYNSKGESVAPAKVSGFLPQISAKKEIQEVEKEGGGTEWKEVTLENYNMLIPASLYLQGLTSEFFVVVEASKGADIYWRQPLIIIQNRYESPMLNEWDGGFKISDADGTIMSTMIGAGYKDNNNRFNGVLMGDLAITELKAGGGASEIASVNRMTGLYGFHEGAQSFGLRIDGTAFFGKAGAGRIEFDGNSGIIKSGNFYYDKDDESNSNNSGMMIDLDDGIIKMFGYKGDNKNKGNVTISTQSPYFKITAYASGITGKTDGDYSLIEISDTKYILQSLNYVENAQGMKINLSDGVITAYQFKLNSQHVIIDSTNSASTYFQVKKDSSNILMHVGQDAYYLQSADFGGTLLESGEFSWNSGSPGSGVSINLFNGHLYVSSKTGELDDLIWEALRLGGSGLYLNSTATASSVALACGSFSVTANGSLQVGSSWQLGLTGIGTLNPNGISFFSGAGLSTLVKEFFDSSFVDLVVNSISGVLNITTSIPWSTIALGSIIGLYIGIKELFTGFIPGV